MENESSWRGPDSCRRARRRASPGLTNRAHQSDEPEFRMMPYRDLEAVACGLEVAYRAVRLMVEGGKTQLVKHDSEWDEPPPPGEENFEYGVLLQVTSRGPEQEDALLTFEELDLVLAGLALFRQRLLYMRMDGSHL